jgi:hypothetical protein
LKLIQTTDVSRGSWSTIYSRETHNKLPFRIKICSRDGLHAKVKSRI